jgi:hypothetical protein
MYSVLNCHNVAKHTKFHLGELRFNVTSTGNAEQAIIKANDKFFFLLEIFLRQLWGCYFMAPSLWREDGYVIYCSCLISPTQSVSGCRDSPSMEGQIPVFISLRDKVAQLYPQALGSLSVSSHDSQGVLYTPLCSVSTWYFCVLCYLLQA